MSCRSDILNHFNSPSKTPAESPLLLLDLTLWHKWHSARGTLPSGFGSSLQDAHRALGVAIWAPFRAWRIEYDGIEVTTEETSDERNILFRAPSRTLTARWTRGPDDDWWQVEYPVKTLDDLSLAVEIAEARRYVIDARGLDTWQASVGEDGVTPLELPMQPYSDLLHTLMGWGEGLLLMRGAGKNLIDRIVAELEVKLQALVPHVAALPGDLLLAADNLDVQYISPRVFGEQLRPSYVATVASAHAAGKPLMVHIGGPGRRLAPLLTEAGVDGIEGIAGPPHGDATLSETRESCGPRIVLWGGVPQDLLLNAHEQEAFENSVSEAIAIARTDAGIILGVADRVPPEADLGRIEAFVDATRLS